MVSTHRHRRPPLTRTTTPDIALEASRPPYVEDKRGPCPSRKLDMIQTYLYRAFGVAGCVAVTTNVYKHGWHPTSVITGVIFAVLMFSLGVAPERRTMAWEIRYLVMVVVVVGLAAFRFLR